VVLAFICGVLAVGLVNDTCRAERVCSVLPAIHFIVGCTPCVVQAVCGACAAACAGSKSALGLVRVWGVGDVHVHMCDMQLASM
jgi:hypothetical protein